MSQLVMSIQRIGVGVLLVSLMLLSSVEARNLQDDWPDLNTGEQGGKVAAVLEQFVQPAIAAKYKLWSTGKLGDWVDEQWPRGDDKPQGDDMPEVEDKPDSKPQPPSNDNKPWQGWKTAVKDFMDKARSRQYPGHESGSDGSPAHPGHDGGEPQQPGGGGDDEEPQQPGTGGGDEPEQPDAGDDSDPAADADGVSDSVLKGVLDLHNQYRARHGVPPLSWSSSVASTAQSYSRRCDMVHSRNQYGENLAKGHRSFDAAVRAWYSEESGYNYNGGGGAGHFTQMVWKSTSQLGCGYSSCGGSPLYVCNYSPPGNYGGRYSENVPPPRN